MGNLWEPWPKPVHFRANSSHTYEWLLSRSGILIIVRRQHKRRWLWSCRWFYPRKHGMARTSFMMRMEYNVTEEKKITCSNQHTNVVCVFLAHEYIYNSCTKNRKKKLKSNMSCDNNGNGAISRTEETMSRYVWYAWSRMNQQQTFLSQYEQIFPLLQKKKCDHISRYFLVSSIWEMSCAAKTLI